MELSKEAFKNEGVYEIASAILKHRAMFATRNQQVTVRAYLLNLAQTFPEDSKPIIALLTGTPDGAPVKPAIRTPMRAVDKGKKITVTEPDPDCPNCPGNVIQKYADPSEFEDDHITNVSKELSDDMDAHNKDAGKVEGVLNQHEATQNAGEDLKMKESSELELNDPVEKQPLIYAIKNLGDNYEEIANQFDGDLQKISDYGTSIGFKPKYNVSKAETYAKHLANYIKETYES